ncbi:MAG: M1 family metallopeptidase [Gemmatimonadaceae bacterium]
MISNRTIGMTCGLAACLIAAAVPARAQYDPHQTFDPTFLSPPGTMYRSGSGAPGPRYWQNESDYRIQVTLDAEQKTLSGTDEITYTNNSPDTLRYLWIQLDQNLYKKDSRGAITAAVRNPRYITPGFDGGYDIHSVEIRDGDTWRAAHYLGSDTRLQIRLDRALAAGGGRANVRMVYAYRIPPFRQRTGWYDTKNGPVFDIAEWYPRMAVYDDVIGWNTLPYLGRGQFYLDYGTMDYQVTVPWNFLVVGSGQLANPNAVLTRTEVDRLAAAAKSDSTVMIRGAAEVADPASRPSRSGTLTWHFAMRDTRDAAWAASPAFVWDAARIGLPDHKTALAESAYPVEVAGETAWGSATQFVKHTIESDSKRWYPYPWPVAIDVAAAAGGMEYPGIVFCDWNSKGRSLWSVTTHEIGHSWFPMLVGSDERQYGFMDEGFNSFIDIYSTLDYDHGRYAPYSAVEDSMPLLAMAMTRTGQPDPIVAYADNVQRSYVGFNNYVKPAAALYLLREDVLGHERFDEAFRAYIQRWAYRHPTPTDFFRTMNDVAGEDLDWFWKEWFYNTWTLDQSVTGVQYVDGDPTKGSVITIGNDRQMVMPTTVRVREANGQSGTVNLPVEIWQQGGSFSFRYDSHSRLDSVIVDPNDRLPDVDRQNNVWTQSFPTGERGRSGGH